MNLTIFNCSDEPTKVNKTLNIVDTYEGTLRENCSIIDPKILVNVELSEGNYAYIEEFGRYYFINNITSAGLGLWIIEMHVDVLYTYRTEIGALNAVIKRQELLWNIYLDDPNFKVYNNKLIQTKTFPNGFNDSPQFVLTVAGG